MITRDNIDFHGQFDGLDAYTIADAGRKRQVGGVIDMLRPQTSVSAFVGQALTARIAYDPSKSVPLNQYGIGMLMDTIRAGQVLMLDGGGLPLTALGDLAMAMLKRQGAVAAVVNARVRDSEAIEAMGFPVFALATGITTLAGHASIVDIGKPVVIDGVRISSGDLVAGCRGGVFVAPGSQGGILVEEARKIADSDQRVLSGILSGEPLTTLWQVQKSQI